MKKNKDMEQLLLYFSAGGCSRWEGVIKIAIDINLATKLDFAMLPRQNKILNSASLEEKQHTKRTACPYMSKNSN
jgi:hypothetical protein